ncbi:MAG: AzlD family protein [Hyphomicrobiales bacterium]|jgi:uncharacterized membrane protein
MSLDPATVMAIIAMALATYATRISGFIIGPYLPEQGRLKQALDAVPAAVLTAVIAPTLFNSPAELFAAVITAIAARRLPALGAITVGVGAVLLGRHFLGPW